jgi:hypothetical protein
MRLFVLTVAALALAGPAAAADDLTPLGDEFAGTALAPEWKLFHREFGWPDKLKALQVAGGALRLEPSHSAWVRDLNAPFLFKSVQGDFDVRARVRVRNAAGGPPAGTWSLGGLMARTPNRSTAAAWTPRAENWHFITTGVGLERGRPVIETKGTYNSYSSLKLRPVEPGWVELRLVRVGMVLLALARPEGGDWQVRDRFYRMEPRPEMQVGLIGYTTSDDVPPGPEDAERINREANAAARTDMVMEVDWIRFARPAVRSSPDWRVEVTANPLADPNLSEAEILRRLGA